MGDGEAWDDMLEDRDFWVRVALPCVHTVARIGGAIARHRDAERAVSFFTKMAWAAIGAQIVIQTEMNYLAKREKKRRIAERKRASTGGESA